MNDELLQTVLKKNFTKMFKMIFENDIKFETNVIIRIDLPELPPDELYTPPDDEMKKEMRGFYIRIDVREIETVAKIVAALRRDKSPVETLAIIKDEDGREIHVPLK